ncbi:hypothetical protein BDV19DRAFT_389937 [Aspergillus venezuelensis]
MDVCSDYLEAKYSGYSVSEMVSQFQELSTLAEMREAVHYLQTLRLPSLGIKDLFCIAKSVWSSIVQADFQNAAALRVSIQAKRPRNASIKDSHLGTLQLTESNDQIRDSQRMALAYCLLGTAYATSHGLDTPESLFGYFLIDAQVGPGLQTSRLKQAISSVQMFLQRCSLAFEDLTFPEEKPLSKFDIDYMFRFRLWKADQQFQQLESKVMHTRLDENGVNNIIKDYIHSLDEIANLRVEANIYDSQPQHSGKPRVHHIFACTRTSQRTFYHRTVTLRSSVSLWTDWTKMDVQIPSYEIGEDGQRLGAPGSYLVPALYNNQVYLFLPEITLGQAQAPQGDKTTYQDYLLEEVDSTKPLRYWEIRLGYTKLTNGRWPTRVVIPSVIRALVQDTDAGSGTKEPDISMFKFWVNQDQATKPLTVTVDWAYPGHTNLEVLNLGEFQIRNEQLVLLDDQNGYATSTRDIKRPRALPEDANRKNAEYRPIWLTSFSRLKYQTSYTTDERWSVDFGRDETARLLPTGLYTTRGEHHPEPPISGDTPLEYPVSFSYKPSRNSLDPYPYVDTLAVKISTIEGTQQYFQADYGGSEEGKFVKFYKFVSPRLTAVAGKGDDLRMIFDCLSAIQHEEGSGDPHKDLFGRWANSKEVHYNELFAPFSIYNWELGVHIPFLVMERLMATQQFELALKVARLVFDPASNGTGVDRCWSFSPFREDSVRKEPLQANL